MNLADLIIRWSRRARWQHSARLAPRGLAVGLAFAVLITIASRLRPLWGDSLLIALGLAAALSGLAIAGLIPWLRDRSHIEWAREFDARFGLGERISTALELESGRIRLRNDALRRTQRADAEASARAIDIRRALPFAMNARALAACLALALAAALPFALPNPLERSRAATTAFHNALQQQTRALEQTRALLQNSPTLDAARRDAALRALDQAQRTLTSPDVTPDQALAALDAAQSKIDALQDAAAQNSQDALQQAGRALPPDASTAALSDALRNGRLTDAAEHLRALDPRTANEAQRTADQLEQIADTVQPADAQLAADLRNAADKMRAGRSAEAGQSLERAAQQMERAQSDAQANEALQRAGEQAQDARAAVQQAAVEMQAGAGEKPGSSTDAGASTTASSAPSSETGAGGSAQAGASGAQPGHSEDVGSASDVYAPERVRTQGAQVALPAAPGDVNAGEGGKSLPAPAGAAQVPYTQVYGQYAAAADEALRNESIPAARRDAVRRYFEGLGK